MQLVKAEKCHRALLHAFECTHPKPKWPRVHSAQWELEVQNWFRGGGSKTPHKEPLYTLVWVTPSGTIGAASHFELRPPGDYADLLFIAVALEHRRQGGKVADACLGQTLDHIAQIACRMGQNTVQIGGCINRSNFASQALFTRHGFACVEESENGDAPAQTWQRFMDIRLN